MSDLTEKYRPHSFEDVLNQDGVISSLKSVLSRPLEKIPHGFLFTGPRGCGKTTLAYIVAKELKCDTDFNMDYMNTSNVRGIDTIRDIDRLCRFIPPTRPGFNAIKYYILDECHELTKSAQNALLALLERPPSHVFFALCTTDPEKLLGTIRDRCHPYEVQSFSRPKLIVLLKKVLHGEGVSMPPSVLKEISTVAEGSARKALKILDSVINLTNEEEILQAIQDTSIDVAEVKDICRIIINKQYKNWPDLCRMLRSIDAEPEKIRRSILSYLAGAAMNSEYNIRLIYFLQIFSEPVMYSGLGGLLAQIGSCFEVDTK